MQRKSNLPNPVIHQFMLNRVIATSPPHSERSASSCSCRLPQPATEKPSRREKPQYSARPMPEETPVMTTSRVGDGPIIGGPDGYRRILRQLPDLGGGRFELDFVRRRFTDWLQVVAGAVLAGADLEGAVLAS